MERNFELFDNINIKQEYIMKIKKDRKTENRKNKGGQNSNLISENPSIPILVKDIILCICEVKTWNSGRE